MTIDFIFAGLLQSLILAIITYGIMIPFRLLNFPDLTVEGAYPLGGAVFATATIYGINPIFSIIASVLCAGLMGIATSLIHLKFRINTLLAGIILSNMAYSINLRIMNKPNIALFGYESLFETNVLTNIIQIFTVLIVCIMPIFYFLKTDFGLRMRTVGLNHDFAKNTGISINKYTILGLFLAGAFFGLAGSITVQIQSYMDVNMGVGIVIHALASLMIGEAIIGNKTINMQMISPLVGAIIYQQIQGIALSFGLEASDLKFFTAFIVLVVVAFKKQHI